MFFTLICSLVTSTQRKIQTIEKWKIVQLGLEEDNENRIFYKALEALELADNELPTWLTTSEFI